MENNYIITVLLGILGFVGALGVGMKLLAEAAILSWKSFQLFGNDFGPGFVDNLKADWESWMDTFHQGISETDLLINGYDKATESIVKYSEGLIGAISAQDTATPSTGNLSGKVGELSEITIAANEAAYKLKDTLYVLTPAEVTAEDKTEQLKKVLKQMADVTMESVGQAIRLKDAIAALESKTITITTMYLSREAYYNGTSNNGGHLSGSQQSGGMQLDSRWINDLDIPVVRGEAILPASLTRAIKENRGSFAGLNVGNDGGSISNYFNISELVVREEADIERIAQQLYSLQQSALRGTGIR